MKFLLIYGSSPNTIRDFWQKEAPVAESVGKFHRIVTIPSMYLKIYPHKDILALEDVGLNSYRLIWKDMPLTLDMQSHYYFV